MFARPTTSERLRREGLPTPPRRSASVILVRGAAAGLELLLVRRNPQQRFMGGFWVFPGGKVDAGESDRATAVRELAEEAAVTGVEPEALVPYSRWITPEAIDMRFDTCFFVARAPDGAEPRVDGQECVDLRWTTAAAAVGAYAAGELTLALPTFKLLESLVAFATVRALLEHAAGLDVRPILPARRARRRRDPGAAAGRARLRGLRKVRVLREPLQPPRPPHLGRMQDRAPALRDRKIPA